jgi:hypothetical protein
MGELWFAQLPAMMRADDFCRRGILRASLAILQWLRKAFA